VRTPVARQATLASDAIIEATIQGISNDPQAQESRDRAKWVAVANREACVLIARYSRGCSPINKSTKPFTVTQRKLEERVLKKYREVNLSR
jgi:hypothetical protein